MCPVAIYTSSNSLMHYSEGSELCPHGNMCTATQLSLHLIAHSCTDFTRHMCSEHTLSVVHWGVLEEQFIV